MLLKKKIQRIGFSAARTFFPAVNLGKRMFLFRADDVLEVLSRDKDFTIQEVNGPHIGRHIGEFMLGIDDGPAYQRQATVFRRAVHPDDNNRIRLFIRQQAHQIVDSLEGKFDLINSYTRHIPYLMMGDYFGVPGPDKEHLLRWCRMIFWDVFLDFSNDAELRTNALQSSQELVSYQKKLIQTYKDEMASGILVKDNMLTRLIAMQQKEEDAFSDEEIPNYLAGVFMGFPEPTNKSLINILRQFLARPAILAQAKEAAKTDNAQAMLGLALEALRFHPNSPLLMRFSPKEQYIGGSNGKKRRRIAANKILFLFINSAMFDPKRVDHPETFKPYRPKETYLYFGHGLHTCFGNYINYISLPEMLIALLKRDDLYPIDKPEFEGPFPDRWMWRRQ